MITAGELREWLSKFSRDDLIAIDDGGLTLVEVTPDGEETGVYLEVGGKPEVQP